MISKETIEKLLKIAKENWYEWFEKLDYFIWNILFWSDNDSDNVECNLIELITSKEFVDSIVNYLYKKKTWWKLYDSCLWTTLQLKIIKNNIQDNIINLQAIAIYNNQLDTFFKSIIE